MYIQCVIPNQYKKKLNTNTSTLVHTRSHICIPDPDPSGTRRTKQQYNVITSRN